MFSVKKGIEIPFQPSKGFLPPKSFIEKNYDDDIVLDPVNKAFNSIQGMAVDYLTRFMLGCSKEEAFSISLEGAKRVNEEKKASDLLSKINGVDDFSIKCACLLVGYDVAYRRGAQYYTPINESIIEKKQISNVRKLVVRSSRFFKENGPIVKFGFTMDGGYNEIISSGDGDYLTKSTLWDLKTSSTSLDKNQTLQLAVYYILGVHSIYPYFKRQTECQTRQTAEYHSTANFYVRRPS